MNSMERFQNVFAGKPVDRPPFSVILSLYGSRLAGCSIEQYYTEPSDYVRAQAAVREVFQPDILFAPFFFAAIGAAFGGKLRYLHHGVPTISAWVIDSAEEWERVRLPDPDRDPHLQFVREALRRMVAGHQGQIPIAMGTLAPCDLPSMIMGPDAWMETVLFDRPAAQRIMQDLIPFFVRLANDYFADGAACVISPCIMTATGIVTREIVTQFSRPVLAEAMAQLHGPMVLHHLDYPFIPHLDLLTDLPTAANAFILGPNDDLHQGRALLGSKRVLMSGPDVQALEEWTAPEIEAFCRARLEDRRTDPHFILANSGGDLTLQTPPENIHAMRMAIEAFEEERV